ncbi:MAG: nitrogen fixation protein NifX [Alphaproteobacteria bacterium]|nr:nitrogen fixation protein NifX [Alphaproteobacteria bacterium]
MKIAFATHDMTAVDAHFGGAKNIAIYDVSKDSSKFVEALQFDLVSDEEGNHDDSVDKLGIKIDALSGCAMLFTLAIGGPAAARVVAKKIHPVKLPRPEPIAEVIARLQTTLAGTPPPWMRRIMADHSDSSFMED